MVAEAQIMVPLDGTTEAEWALPYASALAQATQRRLVLVTVIPATTGTYGSSNGPLPNGNADAQLQHDPLVKSRAYLAVVTQRLRAEQLHVSTEVLRGQNSATTLVTRAEHLPSGSVIVMATQHRHGVAHWRHGSVAEHLLRATAVPLLWVPVGTIERGWTQSITYRTIVVPLDGSSFAEQAVGQAQMLAQATGARLVLVSVVPPTDHPGSAAGGVETAWTQAEQRSNSVQITQAQDRIAAQLRATGCTVATQQVYGDPATAILAVCEANQADLIVMTTHARSGLQRFLLGSVAQGVAARASQPVLLGRPYVHLHHEGNDVPYTTAMVSSIWNDEALATHT